MEPMSFVKACQDFFTRPPHGKKVEIVEFKALTTEDKEELREMLIEMGYDVLLNAKELSDGTRLLVKSGSSRR